MTDAHVIAVYGATGYTGRQVVAELRRRQIRPILVGRERSRLSSLAEGDEVRVATLGDDDVLQRGFEGVSAVINCVGPFEISAEPVAAAAIAAGARYLDFIAEQTPLLRLLERLDAAAKRAGVALVPAVGFYGGLGDLLVSLTAVEVTIAYAVEGWLPTQASRATAGRMAGSRWVRRDGRLALVTGHPRYGSFQYPQPLDVQPVMEDYPLPEALTVSQHVDAPTVRLVMTAATLRESFGPAAPPPERA